MIISAESKHEVDTHVRQSYVNNANIVSFVRAFLVSVFFFGNKPLTIS